jgi:ABC-type transport system substrate-binding protein
LPCRSIAAKSRQKITLGIYPVTDMIQPRFSWAFDPTVREPGYDPARADRLFDEAGWRRGSDGMRRRDGNVLRLVYVQFPESTTGVRVATAVQAALRDRGIDVAVKSVSNAQLFLPRTGVLATGNFDLAYVPWTMGADPDDSSVLRCGAPSNYMRWCDAASTGSKTKRWRKRIESRRKRLYREIATIVARKSRSSTSSTPITSTRIALGCADSRPTPSCRRGTPTTGA